MSKTSDMWLDEQDAAGDELRCEIDHWKTRAEEAEGLLRHCYREMGSTMPGAAKVFAFLEGRK